MRPETALISSIMEAAKKRLETKKRDKVKPATEEGLANNLRESSVYPFVTGDLVTSHDNGEGRVTAHGMKTFVVRYKNGKKGLHDQASTRRWTENGLDSNDTVQHLNEVSNALLGRYSVKASREANRASTNARHLRRADAEEMLRAARELSRKSGQDKVVQHVNKAAQFGATADRQENIARKREDGLQRASDKILSRIKNESIESLNELSRDTLGNYIEKSLVHRGELSKDLNRIHRDREAVYNVDAGSPEGSYIKDALAHHLTQIGNGKQTKINKREIGILKAIDRLKKPDAIKEDRLDEISSDTLASYLKNAIRNKEGHDVEATRGLDLARLVGGEMRDKQLANAEKHHAKSEKRSRGLVSAITHLANSPIDEAKAEKFPDQVVMTSGIRKDLGGGYMAKTRDGKFYKLDPGSLNHSLPRMKSRLDTTKHKFIGQDHVDLDLLKEALEFGGEF